MSAFYPDDVYGFGGNFPDFEAASEDLPFLLPGDGEEVYGFAVRFRSRKPDAAARIIPDCLPWVGEAVPATDPGLKSRSRRALLRHLGIA